MTALDLCGVGREGFTAALKELHALGVIDHDELIEWLRLHGCVLRATEPPLDDGKSFNEQAFAALRRELEQ